jgi:hypothetical protein
MEPPKVNAPSQTTQKTHRSHRSQQEISKEEHEFTQREGIVDVNAIPSPQVEPMSATPVEEEYGAMTTVNMDINSHDSS